MEKILPLFALILISSLWASAGVSIKILLRTLNPFFVGFMRFFIASIIFFPLVRKKIKIKKNFLKDLIPLSLFAASNMVLFFVGIQYTTANIAAILYSSVPLLVAINSHFTIKEPLTKRKIIGILIGLVGLILIFLIPIIKDTKEIGTVRGNLLIGIGALSWSFYTVKSRFLTNTKKYSPYETSLITFITTAVIFFPFALPTFGQQLSILFSNKINIFLVLYYAIFLTIITIGLFQWIAKKTSATFISLSNYLQVVIAIYLNWIFLKEKLTPLFIFASLLVLGGVIIASLDLYLSNKSPKIKD